MPITRKRASAPSEVRSLSLPADPTTEASHTKRRKTDRTTPIVLLPPSSPTRSGAAEPVPAPTTINADLSDLPSELSTTSSSSSSLPSSPAATDSSAGSSGDHAAAAAPNQATADLHARLASFLPRLAAANEALDRELNGSGRRRRDKEVCVVVDGDDGSEGLVLANEEDESATAGVYVEMDVGLGVLEEKRTGSGATGSEASDEQSADEEAAGADGRPEEHNNGTTARRAKSGERDVLGRLMGKRRKIGRAMIQEVERSNG